MNKLTNVNIYGDRLSFQLQLDAEIDENNFVVFVDECDNIDNMYSNTDNDHSYHFNEANSIITIETLTSSTYEITIEREVIEGMNNHMKYIKVFSGENNPVIEGVYYNSETIFNAELAHLKKQCNTCLDDKYMQLLMLIVFKRQLLDSTLDAQDYKSSINLYIDICRLLEIDLNVDTSNKVNVSKCAACIGGYCNLK